MRSTWLSIKTRRAAWREGEFDRRRIRFDLYSARKYAVINVVVVTKAAEKDLRKVPSHIQTKFFAWLDAVTNEGLEVVRRSAGYHDEPLAGDRTGQRSIRLNESYRAFYKIEGLATKLVRVIEVNKHDY
jgi:proteic killer suppression protein